MEEIADVRISIDYLEHLVGAEDDELSHAMRIKADRLKNGTEKYLEEYLQEHPKKDKKKKKGKKKNAEK
uniref:NTP-PPase-like protein n=1 Tax=Myoviridae sp. ctrf010 TaxID=2825182 RepID=A0A8S5P1N3_9CAUD|nr:MAG TPA: NTP-PPase-like protein [Myoviridae sp. ctrf010]